MLDEGGEWVAWDSYRTFKEIAAPTTPETNYLRIYAKDKAGTSALYLLDDAGSEREIGPANAVTGTGTSGQVAFWTSGSVLSGESNLFWDATNNWLGLGTNAPAFRLDIRGAINADVNIVLKEASADTTTPGLSLLKARGTLGSEAATQSGDVLGSVGFGGWTNAYKFNAARIEAVAGSLWSATNSESYISLGTTPNASLTRAERFRVGPAGQWGIGGAIYGTAGDLFKSGGASAPPTWTAPANVTAGSSKITLGGTPTAAALIAFSIDVAEGNLTHNNLGGLTTGDPHTQYALLAGRSGGQTLIGGTAAADDLILRATAGVGVGSESVIVQVGNNGAIEPVRFGQNSGGGVAVFGSTGLITTSASTLVPKLIVTGAGVAHFANIVRHTTVGAGGAVFGLYATRGAGVDTHTALQAGDGIGTLQFEGSDGTRYLAAAGIRATVATTFTTDTAIANLLFVANDGSSVSAPPTRMSIGGASGNVRIGASAPGSNGTQVLEFEDGTAPTSMGTNTAGLYAEDGGGTVELWAVDEAGNDTLQTPHNFSLFDPPADADYPWSYFSRNRYIGKEIGVDMWRLVKAVEKLSGEKILYVRDLPVEEIRDWAKDQEENFRRAAAELARYEKLSPEEKAERTRPPEPIMKLPPKWMIDRLKIATRRVRANIDLTR